MCQQKDGCYMKRALSTQAQCCCAHLSTFAVLLENSLPTLERQPNEVLGGVLSGA